MKQRMKYLILFLPLLVLFAGCADESQLRLQDGGILLGISSVSTNTDKNVSDLYTRSATIIAGGSIGVYRLSSSDYTAQNNVEYSYGTRWTTTAQIYISNKTASVCAYYPYSTSIGDNPATTGTVEGNDDPTAIPLTSQTYNSAADLCYASATSVSSSNPYANFTMDRAYAKMTFTITHDASYSGTCAISSIKISNAGIRSSNTLDITSGSYGTTTATGSTIFNPAIASIASGSSTTATALIVPTISDTTSETLTGNITFLLTVDGKTRVASLPVSTNNLTTLAPGSNYQINVKISGSGMTLALAATAGNGGFDLDAVTPPANSYIVAPGASLTIPVGVKGNKDSYTSGLAGLSITHTAASVGIYWQTGSKSLISLGAFNATDQTVTVTAGASEGNAVIAAYSGAAGTGDILWSWHIWVTDEPASETVNEYTWMDRNLGATEVATNVAGVTFATCGGLLYQWGRKDPFPGSNGLNYATMLPIYSTSAQLTSSETILPWPSGSVYIGTTPVKLYDISSAYASQCSYSIKYPLLFLQNWAGSTATQTAAYTTAGGKSSWGGENGESKSIFDPCPGGWQLPSSKVSSPIYSSPWSLWTIGQNFTTSTYAALLWSPTPNTFRYPAPGYRYDDGMLYSVGSYGFYWSSSVAVVSSINLVFSSGFVIPNNGNLRSNAFSVRCVKE